MERSYNIYETYIKALRIYMKKNAAITVIIAVALFVLIAGGYIILHRRNTPLRANSTANNSSTAASNVVLATKTDSSLGQYFTEPNGQALYTYGGDTPGVSNCSGSCLANWPAYQDKGSVANLPAGVGTITRTDNGEIQFTYNGMPLYTFVSDRNGQVTGNGVGNFSVARPAASASSSSNQSAVSGVTVTVSGNTDSSHSASNW